MGQQYAQLLDKSIFNGMDKYIGKVFPVVDSRSDGRLTLELEDHYRLSFPPHCLKLFEAVEEPAPKLEWKVGTKVMVENSEIDRPYFNSRVGYVGTIEVIDHMEDRFKVKFPEASFKPMVDGGHYSSWWFKDELLLVPDDYEGGKKPKQLKLNDKCYIAGDGEHLTKDISKANMTEDYQKHLSNKLTASFAELYAADRLF